MPLPTNNRKGSNTAGYSPPQSSPAAKRRHTWGWRRLLPEKSPPSVSLKLTLPEKQSNQQLNQRAVSTLEQKHCLNDQIPFADFWQPAPSATVFHSTVAHSVLQPGKQERDLHGQWHIKRPARVSRLEKHKRQLVALFYKITGQSLKARYYQNVRSLAEKEVLAGKLNRAFLLSSQTYASVNWHHDRQMHYGYSFDESTGDHCVASQHIRHHHTAASEPGRQLVFDGEHNPVTAFTFRHFFLGDADCMKKDNYLVQYDPDTGKRSFVSIDFGMAFHDLLALPDNITFPDFVKRVLKPSLAYRLHYAVLKRGDSIADLIQGMSPGDQIAGVAIALFKIAALPDSQLKEIVQQVSDPHERSQLYQTLQARQKLARHLYRQSRTFFASSLKEG